MSTLKYTDPNGNEWTDWKSYKQLEVRLNQAMGALGFTVPGDTPETDLRCGLCKHKEEDFKKSQIELQTAWKAFRMLAESMN